MQILKNVLDYIFYWFIDNEFDDMLVEKLTRKPVEFM